MNPRCFGPEALQEIEVGAAVLIDGRLSVSKLPEGAAWIWEMKLDGYRALTVKSGTGVTLFSRRGKSLNKQFPYIVEALASLPEGTIVDGEVVILLSEMEPMIRKLAEHT